MRHFCPYKRHTYECELPRSNCQDWCKTQQICRECQRASVAVASLIVPVICERCGKQKRHEDGRSLYVALVWKRGKRMVCPDCHLAEQVLEGLEKVVSWDDADDEVPF